MAPLGKEVSVWGKEKEAQERKGGSGSGNAVGTVEYEGVEVVGGVAGRRGIWEEVVRLGMSGIPEEELGAKVGLSEWGGKRVWREGYPKDGLVSAKEEVLRREMQREVEARRVEVEELKEKARVALEEKEAAETELARIHESRMAKERLALEASREMEREAREDTQLLTSGCKQNALKIMAVTSGWLDGAMKFVPHVEEALTKLLVNGKIKNVEEVLAITRTITKIAKEGHEAAMKAVEIERLLQGEPTEIVGVTQVIASSEEVNRQILLAKRNQERARKLSLLPADQESPRPSSGPVRTPPRLDELPIRPWNAQDLQRNQDKRMPVQVLPAPSPVALDLEDPEGQDNTGRIIDALG